MSNTAKTGAAFAAAIVTTAMFALTIGELPPVRIMLMLWMAAVAMSMVIRSIWGLVSPELEDEDEALDARQPAFESGHDPDGSGARAEGTLLGPSANDEHGGSVRPSHDLPSVWVRHNRAA